MAVSVTSVASPWWKGLRGLAPATTRLASLRPSTQLQNGSPSA